MKINKFFLVMILFVFSMSIHGETDKAYNELMNEYESLLDDYDELLLEAEQDNLDDTKSLEKHNELLKDYKDLGIEFESSKKDLEILTDKYSRLNIEFTNLNETYLLEVDFHNTSKESLESAKLVLSNARQSLKDVLDMTDNKYFTMYPQLGYLGDEISVGFAVGMRVPKLPITFLFDVDYLPSNDKPINLQIGVGIRF